MSQDLTLYIDSHFFSPYAMFAYVALREKGVPFRTERVNLDDQSNRDPAFQQRSLTSRVPTLTHGDFSLSESSAIIEYLDEVFPAPQYLALLPGKTRQRARARQLQAWLRSDLAPLRQERPTTLMFGGANGAEPLSRAAQAAAQQLLQVADQLVSDLSPNLFGAWCIADTELALMLNRLVAGGDTVPHKLRTYVNQQWRRPSVQHWLNHEEA